MLHGTSLFLSAHAHDNRLVVPPQTTSHRMQFPQQDLPRRSVTTIPTIIRAAFVFYQNLS